MPWTQDPHGTPCIFLLICLAQSPGLYSQGAGALTVDQEGHPCSLRTEQDTAEEGVENLGQMLDGPWRVPMGPPGAEMLALSCFHCWRLWGEARWCQALLGP